MREQVWADRVRLRHKMKKEMKQYREFWQEHGDAVASWCREQSPRTLKKLLQMPRSGVTERLKSQYNIHSAYAIVLCTVVEQVSRFKDTNYPTDARGDTETAFENALLFDRRCGFTLSISNEDGSLNEHVLNVWLERTKSLGGPKLLDRGPSSSKQEDDDDEEGGGADDGQERDPEDTKPGPSFRADRRIVRLLIARYWADMLMKKYLAHVEKVVEEKAVAINDTGVGSSQVESMTEKLSL